MAEMVSRFYSNFRGVDFRGGEVSLYRSPSACNMFKDYGRRYSAFGENPEMLHTRPALKSLAEFEFDPIENAIYGIYPFKTPDEFDRDEFIVHSGTGLFRCTPWGTAIQRIGSVAPHPSNGFTYNNILYIKEGHTYKQYDGNEVKDVVGYVPTTSIGRKPSGGGSIHEDVNLLSDYRINTFVADGESKEYFLDAQDINEVVEVKVNGTSTTAYSVDTAKGKITFNTAPTKPLTDGQDNVSIKYRKYVSGYANKILNCTLLQVFDNRVFFSGNPDYPNVIFHSSLDDPTYCSDLDYYAEGLDTGKVKGMVAGNNALWVFKEPNIGNTTVFYHVPTIDSEYGKIYPSTHSSITTGCVGKAINFNDDIVFFSSRGMEGINGDVTTEQVIAHRSSLVDSSMTHYLGYGADEMVLAEWEGYLLVIIDRWIFLADSRAKFTNEDHYEYEWFYWEIEGNSTTNRITSACVYDGNLYLGTSGGYLWSLTDTEGNVPSYWTTPKDKFKYPQMQKTSNKRGCVCEATGDVSVYASTENTDFELIGEYKDVKDYFVSRIKRKKFKDIQLKFESYTRFSLESATLECFIGGYIKR